MLGVSKGATKDEIKAAYFKKAKIFHPDISPEKGAKEQFRKISEAYETLGDDSKRRSYDFNEKSSNFRQAYEQRQREQSANPNDFSGFKAGHASYREARGGEAFDDFFRGFEDFVNFRSPKGGKKKSKAQARPSRGKNVVMNLDLDFMEAISGVKKQVKYHKMVDCEPCEGTGSQRTANKRNCETCHGTGYVNVRHGRGYSQYECPSCFKKGSCR